MSSSRGLTGLLILLASLAYMSFFAFRGWTPHDEGLLGLTAERFARGDLPHVDYQDPYTGGLAGLHALAFALWGAKLSSLRWMLLIFATVTVPLIYYLASRFLQPSAAAAVTFSCVIWGPASYFAPLPSWYNLFLAIAGCAALWKGTMEHDKAEPQRRWLFIAGLCGGLSILIKVVGIYFVVAAALFLISVRKRGSVGVLDRPALILRLLLLGAATPFVLIVLRGSRSFMEIGHFIVPPLVMIASIACISWRERERSESFRSISITLLTFGAGVTAPIAMYVIPYIRRNALGALVHGVLILPQKRIASAAWPLPDSWTLVFAVPFAMLVLFVVRDRKLGDRWFGALGVVLFSLLLYGYTNPVYSGIWYSLRPMIPITAFFSCWVILKENKPEDTLSSRKVNFALLMTLVTVFHSLVQYPYAYGIYFCYVAPLLILAIAALFSLARAGTARLQLMALLFFALFGVLWVNSGDIRAIGQIYRAVDRETLLLPDRAGLRVSAAHAAGYTRIAQLVLQKADGDRYIYAGPDSPEMYFLTRKENPLTSIYEFFDEPQGRFERILEMLQNRGVNLVIVNSKPEFSQLDPRLLPELRRRYPMGEAVGPFVILWKNRDH